MASIQHPVKPEELMTYLDGELPAERAAELAVHVEQCMECRALVADFGSVSERLVEWQVEPAPEPLDKNISEVVEKRFAKATKAETARQFDFTALDRPPRRILRWALGLSAAGVAVLVLFAISVPNLWRSRQAANLARNMSTEVDIQPVLKAPTRLGGSGAPAADLERLSGIIGSSASEAPQRMIARTANLTLVTKDFDASRAALERIARQHQGYIAKLDASGSAGMARQLSATLRIPASQLDPALGELKQQGRVAHESLSGEEVTRQYTDLNARLSNARVTEQRLNAILSNRTGKVSDVLEVEQEIARVRGQIERMDAERKDLENRVSYATVEVTLTEDYKAEINVPPPSTGTELWNAAVAGYRALVDNALGLATGLLIYGPTLLFWLALFFWPARLVWRRIRT
jgi:Domain of unknown function (DUF4349)/Putative zinc-finger